MSDIPTMPPEADRPEPPQPNESTPPQENANQTPAQPVDEAAPLAEYARAAPPQDLEPTKQAADILKTPPEPEEFKPLLEADDVETAGKEKITPPAERPILEVGPEPESETFEAPAADEIAAQKVERDTSPDDSDALPDEPEAEPEEPGVPEPPVGADVEPAPAALMAAPVEPPEARVPDVAFPAPQPEDDVAAPAVQDDDSEPVEAAPGEAIPAAEQRDAEPHEEAPQVPDVAFPAPQPEDSAIPAPPEAFLAEPNVPAESTQPATPTEPIPRPPVPETEASAVVPPAPVEEPAFSAHATPQTQPFGAGVCPRCGGQDFAKGGLINYGTKFRPTYYRPGRLSFRRLHNMLRPFRSLVEVEAQVCRQCGHVLFQVDTDRLNKIDPRPQDK